MQFPSVLENLSEQKIPIGMTLSLNKKIPIEISQNPYKDEFEFERKNTYRDFPPALETFEFDRKKSLYGCLPVLGK
eukprot:UN27088